MVKTNQRSTRGTSGELVFAHFTPHAYTHRPFLDRCVRGPERPPEPRAFHREGRAHSLRRGHRHCQQHVQQLQARYLDLDDIYPMDLSDLRVKAVVDRPLLSLGKQDPSLFQVLGAATCKMSPNCGFLLLFLTGKKQFLHSILTVFFSPLSSLPSASLLSKRNVFRQWRSSTEPHSQPRLPLVPLVPLPEPPLVSKMQRLSLVVFGGARGGREVGWVVCWRCITPKGNKLTKHFGYRKSRKASQGSLAERTSKLLGAHFLFLRATFFFFSLSLHWVRGYG